MAKNTDMTDVMGVVPTYARPTMSPLNPSLYNILDNNIGVHGISDEGAEMHAEYRADRDGRMVMDVISAGEYYRVACPLCNDTRGRLWINYRWGVRDPITGDRNYFLAHCYNENCLSEPGAIAQLRALTTQYIRRAKAGRVTLNPGKKFDPSKPIEMPSDCEPLDTLPDDHPAIRYLKQRRFDVDEVQKRWGVQYSRRVCSFSPNGRLVIPFYGASSYKPLLGWQARRLDATDNGPKYYTARGTKKSRVLYGLPRVRDEGPVVLCEGPTDVWRLGRNAVAFLGKKASEQQVQLVREHLHGRPLVVMLDADAVVEAGALVTRITAMRRASLLRTDKSSVVQITLPSGRDPADHARDELWQLVDAALRRTARPRSSAPKSTAKPRRSSSSQAQRK